MANQKIKLFLSINEFFCWKYNAFSKTPINNGFPPRAEV